VPLKTKSTVCNSGNVTGYWSAGKCGS